MLLMAHAPGSPLRFSARRFQRSPLLAAASTRAMTRMGDDAAPPIRQARYRDSFARLRPL